MRFLAIMMAACLAFPAAAQAADSAGQSKPHMPSALENSINSQLKAQAPKSGKRSYELHLGQNGPRVQKGDERTAGAPAGTTRRGYKKSPLYNYRRGPGRTWHNDKKADNPRFSWQRKSHNTTGGYNR
jgi:hypothetical protein